MRSLAIQYPLMIRLRLSEGSCDILEANGTTQMHKVVEDDVSGPETTEVHLPDAPMPYPNLS